MHDFAGQTFTRTDPLIFGESDAGKSYLAKSIEIKACNRYNVGYFHSEELLESMATLREQDYDKYARKMKKYLRWELIILDDFLLHTITDKREIKIPFELLEKRNEQGNWISAGIVFMEKMVSQFGA